MKGSRETNEIPDKGQDKGHSVPYNKGTAVNVELGHESGQTVPIELK